MADKPETKPEEEPKDLPKKDKPLSDEELGGVVGGARISTGCACMSMQNDPKE